MSGLGAVFWKELTDSLSSRRFLILLGLIYLTCGGAIYLAANYIRAQVSESSFVFLLLFTASPIFLFALTFFIPILGIALGFDNVNSERNSGTLVRVLSQPVYRDAVINGKFLAGLVTISTLLVSVVLLVSGLGLRMIGVPPQLEEITRLTVFVLLAIVYSGFWLSLGVLFSLLFSRPATSALASIAVWLVLSFVLFVYLSSSGGAFHAIARFSPTSLFFEGTLGLLVPSLRTLSGVLPQDTSAMLANPLPFSQSFLLVWPDIVALLVLTIVCFAIAYLKFMREEIRYA